MRDNHIPFGNQDAPAECQLQLLDKREIVQAGRDTSQPSISTVSKSATGEISPVPGGRPFDPAQPGFIEVIGKFVGDARPYSGGRYARRSWNRKCCHK